MTDTLSLDTHRQEIEAAWEARAGITPDTQGSVRDAIEGALSLLDSGHARVAEPKDGKWQTHDWLKKAVLLAFRLWPMTPMAGLGAPAFDKVPLKYKNWQHSDFTAQGARVVPGAIVRHGAHVAADAVLMPSFVNIGAYVGAGTMVDTWATIGSCAQIGSGCHISGGAGIGGVLEPLQATPTIIEDKCFIGARAEVAEGVIVREGAVIAMGTFLSASTKIVDRQTGDIRYGEVPPYAVVVPGSLPDPNGGPSLNCAVIVKKVDEKTRSKTGVNELLRY